MAFPLSDSYSAPSGEGIYAGVSVYPAWRSAMAANTWLEIPASNTLDDIDPANDPLINPNHPLTAPWGQPQSNIIAAWCGACFAEERSELHIPYGGGHNDYAGNELYAIKLDIDVPEWEMYRAPSGAIGNQITLNDGQESTGLYSDGKPRSCHTYNGVSWATGLGPVIVPQGAVYQSGNGSGVAHIVDPDTGDLFDTIQPHTSANGTVSQAGSCYDPSRHAIWKRGKGTAAVQKLDLATKVWTNVTSTTTDSGDVCLEYIPVHDVVIHATNYPSERIRVIDCVTGAITEPAVTGSMVGSTIGGAGQWRYVESLNALAKWDNTSDTTIINLLNIPSDPKTDTWTITQLTVAGGNAVTPTAKAANGTFGRFFYSKKLNGFGLINSTTQPIYFFAL